jgi:hypothetical protein
MLVSAGVLAGGCATAGLALVGPLAGSLTAIADRSVERTLPADLGTTWGATVDALARMAVRVEQADRSGPKWRLTGAGEAVTVHGALERVTAGMTRVSVRVEGGGLFADKKTGDELLNQVAASLATFARAGRRDGSASGAETSVEHLRGLQREIERLGARIEQAREAPPPTARPEPIPPPAQSPAPIITIPASAGLATGPLRDAPAARPVIPSAPRPSVGPSNSAAAPPVRAARQEEGRAEDILAVPMQSVEVLRPVNGLGARPSGQ